MRVLSLFDGVSCARVALDRAGIEVETYYASEIEKNAMKVSKKNWPDIVQVGSVVGLVPPPDIDLLIGGSPCQDLSIAKKDRKGLGGERSGLFWEYVRLLRELKPTWFVLENVASMPKADRDIITKEMGVEPVLFNASLVSAQSRKRLFWTNIPFQLPTDKGILLKDILQPDVEEKFYISKTMTSNGKTTGKVGFVGDGEQYGQGGQAHRVYSPEGKTPTLSSSPALVKIGGRDVILTDSPLQVIKEGRTELGKQSRKEGKDTRSTNHKAYFGKEGTKANCLTTVLGAEGLVVIQDRIRKLTPIECERLQGLPDNYTEGVATTHRYKCLGNAFNVDVVTCILRGIHPEL